MKQVFFSSLLSVFLGLSLLGTVGCQTKPQGPEKQSLEVSVVEMKKEDVVIYQDFVGTVDGIENAEIRARVAGYLEAVHFREGAEVKTGELLFTIDPVLSEAEVRKARGDLAMAQASLAKSQADVNRLSPLVATNAVSRQELDHAQAAKDEASAQVLAAQGNLATAQASLDYTKVKSPIDGIIGLRQVSIGSLVGQGEPTLLTTVSQLDTVRVRFPISEQLYLEHAALLSRLANAGERTGRLQLILADGSIYPHKGWLALVDRAISISTGSIILEARFPNPEGVLRPGQFARVRAPVGRVDGAIGVLQRAVIERQSMHELLVLDKDGKVARKPVTMGPKVGSYWLIEKGVEPGDRVLIEGLQKVKPGMVVKPELVPSEPISPPPPGEPADLPPADEDGPSKETEAKTKESAPSPAPAPSSNPAPAPASKPAPAPASKPAPAPASSPAPAPASNPATRAPAPRSSAAPQTPPSSEGSK